MSLVKSRGNIRQFLRAVGIGAGAPLNILAFGVALIDLIVTARLGLYVIAGMAFLVVLSLSHSIHAVKEVVSYR